VPWCDTCDRFLSPSTVLADGSCPSCGRAVEPGGASQATGNEQEDEGLGPIPWHLKLLLGALAVYLGWRAWQGIEWVAHSL
jgi:hypothetical protein